MNKQDMQFPLIFSILWPDGIDLTLKMLLMTILFLLL